jgi:hypothetical protein
MVMKNYGWNLEDPEDYDLCTRRKSGYYDVCSGVDGWVVHTPNGTWAFDGRSWQHGKDSAPPRGVPGAVTREEARVFAEQLINQVEG